MAINVRSAAEIAKKFIKVAPQRTEDYKRGVETSQNDWERNTAQAEERYVEGVTIAAAEGRFGRGVAKAGNAKYKQNTLTKGVRNWPIGIRDSEEAYRKGMEPVVAVLQGIDLPPRFPKGDPRNIDRVTAVTVPLHALKTG